MKFLSLNCPNCNGGLEIEDGLDVFFCKYCGQKIILEGQDAETINAKVKIKEFQHHENLQKNKFQHDERLQKSKDDLAKYKLEAKAEYDKRTNRLIIIALLPLLLSIVSIAGISVGVLLLDNAEEKKIVNAESQIIEFINNGEYDMALEYADELPTKKRDNYISIINTKLNETAEATDIEIPFSSKYAKGKNYEELVKMLKDAGFTNVSISALEDDAFFFTKTDKIEKIIIDGKTTFKEGAVYKSNVKIVVYYYE